MKTTVRLAILGLAGYGGYTLWSRYGTHVASTQLPRGDIGPPSPRRVRERSHLTDAEWTAGSDDPVAQATAVLTESDERSRLPRASDGIEHRRSEDTVEP